MWCAYAVLLSMGLFVCTGTIVLSACAVAFTYEYCIASLGSIVMYGIICLCSIEWCANAVWTHYVWAHYAWDILLGHTTYGPKKKQLRMDMDTQHLWTRYICS